MKVKKYIGNTMQEAMNQVKKDLGSDAVILQTKTVPGGFFGLFPRQRVEITAASDVVAARPPAAESVPVGRRPKAALADHLVGDDVTPTTRPDCGSARRTDGLEAATSDIRISAHRLSSLEEKIALLTSTVEKLVEKSTGGSTLPGLWEEVSLRLQRSGIEPLLARQLAERFIGGSHEAEHYLEQDALLIEALGKDIIAAGGIRAPEEGQKVIVLIGPTGVGKTTTLAKIAADFLTSGRRIGFITADTYRLAAVEQLQKYADIMGLALETVYTPKEMEEAIARQSDREVVFVDTAGRSQHNASQMEELKALVEACQPAEVHLLLSATTKREDLQEIVERFSICPIDRLILTKADESTCFGPFYSIIRQTSIPFSYITTGQNVPEDIEEATTSRIARLICQGGLENEGQAMVELESGAAQSASALKVES